MTDATGTVQWRANLELVRNVNLIEALMEKAALDGDIVEEPPADWSEEKIRAHFRKAAATPCQEYQEPDPEDFKRWFPGLHLSRTAWEKPRTYVRGQNSIHYHPCCCNAPAASCWRLVERDRLRVLCFPNAGSAEDMFTSEGSGTRRVSSPLLEWCRSNAAEVLAMQPPGRNMRMREQPITTCQHMATALLPVVAAKLTTTPYVGIAHSVGSWNAYEFLMLARSQGLPMPKHLFLSAMASPDLLEEERPWRRNSSLDEEAFKEECRGWDVNELVFGPAMWPTYHSLMRADFTLFDAYKFQHAGAAPLDCPVTAFYGTRDRRITKNMMAGWRRFTTGRFELLEIAGHHLWPLDKEAKVSWLGNISERLTMLES